METTKHIVQIKKKEGGEWHEVAAVNDAPAATTVGDSFLAANSAKAYRVLAVVVEKAR